MPRTVALDANLLVLLTVGLTDPKYIESHKRLKAYRVYDFDLLKRVIAGSAGVVVTPSALSEASNLLRQIGEPARSKIGHVFRILIAATPEVYVKSTDAARRLEFLRVGLSDSALLEVSKSEIAILSVDHGLCIAAQKAGYEAVNFNHLRGL